MTAALLPAAAGIGLRLPYMAALAREEADAPLSTPWVEIHSENFLMDGGPRLAMLDAVAARYPISCHGVGLSLGSAEGLDQAHVARLKRLFDRVRPKFVSEHLAWSVTEGVYLNDLLPLPLTEAVLDVVSRNVAEAQAAFGRKILVENPSRYVQFAGPVMSESEFLAALVERTGCGLLLDINNVYVSAVNHRFDADAYLRALPAAAIGEIHLAGYTESGTGDEHLLIDTHSTRVSGAVWSLYETVIGRIGARPTLIEWDADVPDLSAVLKEAATAQAILDAAAKDIAHVA